MMDFAAVVIAVAFLVLVGYLIPTVIQLRRTAAEAQQVLSQINRELPGLLKELHGTTENVNAITTQAKQGVDRASVLMNAIGDVGQTVNQMHGAVKGRSTAFVLGLVRVLSGLKAAAGTIADRVHKEGGQHNGRE